jgi:hypothetical protein
MAGPRPLGIPMLNGPVTAYGPDGAEVIHFKVAPGLHRVPDGIATAALAGQLTQNVGPAWFCCLILAGGHAVIRPSGPGIGTPDKPLQALLTGIAIALNSHEARDGHWVTALDMQEHEVVAAWRDRDGDMHLTIAFGEPTAILAWTDIEFAAQAAAALDEWQSRVRDVDVLQRQMVRAALGEKPAVH